MVLCQRQGRKLAGERARMMMMTMMMMTMVALPLDLICLLGRFPSFSSFSFSSSCFLLLNYFPVSVTVFLNFLHGTCLGGLRTSSPRPTTSASQAMGSSTSKNSTTQWLR
jgi:hypothetical protein